MFQVQFWAFSLHFEHYNAHLVVILRKITYTIIYVYSFGVLSALQVLAAIEFYENIGWKVWWIEGLIVSL